MNSRQRLECICEALNVRLDTIRVGGGGELPRTSYWEVNLTTVYPRKTIIQVLDRELGYKWELWKQLKVVDVTLVRIPFGICIRSYDRPQE